MYIDLLAPKFKVTAKYLFSPYEIGDIIETNDNYNSVHLATTNEIEMGEQKEVEHFYDINDCSLYPAIFKKLEWWEEREEKDMPEYVKFKHKTQFFDQNEVVHVKKWKMFPDRVIGMMGDIPAMNYECRLVLPATEEEYINQSTINKPVK